VAGPRALLGRTGECGRERASRPCGWAELEVKKGNNPIGNFVFLFQKCE
jgi:hypothetical protein